MFKKAAPRLNDWSKPARRHLRKEGTSRWSRDGTARSYPRMPACHGSPYREDSSRARRRDLRAYGKKIEDTIRRESTALAPLRYHTARVLIRYGPTSTSLYQGILIPIRKVHRKTPFSIQKRWVKTVFGSRRVRRMEDENADALIKFVREHQCAEFPRVRASTPSIGGRNQKGARTEQRVSFDCSTICSGGMPGKVDPRCWNWTTSTNYPDAAA